MCECRCVLGVWGGCAKEAKDIEDVNRRSALLRYQEEVCMCEGVGV